MFSFLKNCGIFFIYTFVLAVPAYAHPYLPLNPGATSTLNYSFTVETDKKEFSQADTKGTIHVVSDKWEDKVGKKYLLFITSYKGISFMKEDARLWRREENGSIFIGSEINGVFSESIELPANLDLGTKWKYNDGVESVREITAKTEVKLANGDVLKDCLEVTRTPLNNISLKGVIDKSYYCKDKGAVRSLFIQASPVGNYKTETLRAE